MSDKHTAVVSCTSIICILWGTLGLNIIMFVLRINRIYIKISFMRKKFRQIMLNAKGLNYIKFLVEFLRKQATTSFQINLKKTKK